MKTKSYPRMENLFTQANEANKGQKHRPETIPPGRVLRGGAPCIPLRCLRYLLFNPLGHVVLALATLLAAVAFVPVTQAQAIEARV